LSDDEKKEFRKMGVAIPQGFKVIAHDWYYWPWDARSKGKANGSVTFKGQAWYFELPGRKCNPPIGFGPRDPTLDPYQWTSPEVFLKYLGFRKEVPGAMAGNLWYITDSKFAAAKKQELMAQMHGNVVNHDLKVKWDETIDKKTKLVSAVPKHAE
jgi:hypothetical protein